MAKHQSTPVFAAGEKLIPCFRTASVATADFSDDTTFQIAIASEYPGEMRASKAHERLGIAKEGEKFVEVLSHDEGDVNLDRMNSGRAALLDEHKDTRHLGHIRKAVLSDDKVTRAIVKFDCETKLSKTRCRQMRSGSRPLVSVGYVHTAYLGKVELSDGRTAHRFAWQGLEVSSTSIPMDPTVGLNRSADEMCHCFGCGTEHKRSDMKESDGALYCSDECIDAEEPAEDEGRTIVSNEVLKRMTAAGHAAPDETRKFRSKKGDQEIEFTHSQLKSAVSTAADSDKRFKIKRPNGNLISDFYIYDIEQSGSDLSAIIVGPEYKVYRVGFTFDGTTATLADDMQEVSYQGQWQPVGTASDSAARSTTTTAVPPVDSVKISRTAEPPPNNLPKPVMPKTAAELTTENPEAITEIRTAERTATRTAVVKEFSDNNTKVTEFNKEVRALAAEAVKTYGRRWNGKSGEVYVVGERIRTLEAEICSRDVSHDGTERRTDFKRGLDLLITGSRDPKNQEEAANLPDELASRCSLRSLYNAAARAQAKGDTNACFKPTDGAEFEADKELRSKAQDFPGGAGVEMGGVCLPVNMAGYRLRGSARQIRRLTRDALAGDFPTAGALIAPEFKFPTIELLRNKMALGRAGIMILGGVIGNLVLPRQVAPTTSQSLAEGAALAQYDQTFDQIRMVPHRIGSSQNYSRLALLQQTEDFEAIVMNDHMAQNALRADYLVLNGSGGADEPLGLMNQIGIGVVTFGGSAANAYKNLVALETSIRKANIDEEPSFITTSVGRGTLRITPATLTGSTVVSGESNALWVGEEIIGRPAVDSQQVPNDAVIALVGRHVVMAQWGGWQVVLDTFSRADRDQIKLSMNTYIDACLRHPQAVARSADAITTLT